MAVWHPEALAEGLRARGRRACLDPPNDMHPRPTRPFYT